MDPVGETILLTWALWIRSSMKGNLDRRVRSQWTLLPWDIGVVHVTGISWDKFPHGNIYGYVKKKIESAHDIWRVK